MRVCPIQNDLNQPSTVPPNGVQNCPGGGNISLKIIFLLVELCVFPELKSRKIPISLRACDLTPRLALAIKKVSIDEMEFWGEKPLDVSITLDNGTTEG